MTVLKRVLENRAKVWEQAKALLDTAEGEGRELTSEEEEQWTKLNEELARLDKRITELRELEERNQTAAAASEQYGADQPDQDPESELTSDAETLRAIASGEIRGADFSFAEQRDLTVGTATDGAELVPTGFLNRLVEHLIENAAIVGSGASVLRTASGEAIQIPKTTSYSTAAIVAEAGAIGESDPQFDQATLDAYKYAFLVQVSSELLQDSAIDIVDFLARQGGQALGNGFGAHVATGTGTAQPNGLFTAATTGKTGAAAAPDEDDLIDLKHSVIAPYRRRSGAAWVMNDTTLAGIRKLKDSQGAFLWQPSMIVGNPDLILGHPVVVDSSAPATGVGNDSVAFGDLSGYYARLAGGVRIERSDHFAFANDLVTFRFILRADGDLIDTNAVKVFTGA